MATKKNFEQTIFQLTPTSKGDRRTALLVQTYAKLFMQQYKDIKITGNFDLGTSVVLSQILNKKY
jgi:hypothetical protein